mmetsp:Transcript_24989/g.24452  ORF Transcript_24989/g.24452 Transcript_24989/m.24452 type:complete len:116 (-) Transcript_24989:877-1224(-)
MRDTAVLPELPVPPVVFLVEATVPEPLLQLFQIVLSCTPSNDFADPRNYDIHRLYCLLVFILLHVERLYVLRKVGDHNRSSIESTTEELFMFSGEIYSPGDFIRKLDCPLLHLLF